MPASRNHSRADRNHRFDEIDRAILRELQDDAKLANSTLAERVGISPSSTLERVKKLEKAGVIRDYIALLDPAQVNQSVAAIVHVSMREHSTAMLESTKLRLARLPEVQACWYCAGDEDFILKVRVEDMQHYERFVSQKLAAVDGIGKLRTSFVLGTVKDTPRISLDAMQLRNGA